MTADGNNEFLPIAEARTWLATIWFSGSGLILLILLATSFGDVFQGKLEQVWSVSLSTVLPTLSLILSVLGANAIVERREKGQTFSEQPADAFVRRDFFRLTWILSVVYLLLVVVSFFAHPFVTAASAPAVTAEEVLREWGGEDAGGDAREKATSAADVILFSNLWLAPLQGLVVAAMGVLFFTKRD